MLFARLGSCWPLGAGPRSSWCGCPRRDLSLPAFVFVCLFDETASDADSDGDGNGDSERDDGTVYQCPRCPYTTPYAASFECHQAVPHNKLGTRLFKCPHCVHMTTKRTNLRLHVHRHHDGLSDEPIEVPPLMCDHCSFATLVTATMRSHRCRGGTDGDSAVAVLARERVLCLCMSSWYCWPGKSLLCVWLLCGSCVERWNAPAPHDDVPAAVAPSILW